MFYHVFILFHSSKAKPNFFPRKTNITRTLDPLPCQNHPKTKTELYKSIKTELYNPLKSEQYVGVKTEHYNQSKTELYKSFKTEHYRQSRAALRTGIIGVINFITFR